MSEWKQEFRKAVIDVIVAEGSPVRDGSGFWGWMADDWEAKRKRVAAYGIDYAATKWDESRWWDGGDTFNDGTEKIGLDADIAVKDGSTIKFRYEGTITEILHSILASTE
jgi:hypothetical protein